MHFENLKARWRYQKEQRRERARRIKQTLLEKGPAVFVAYGVNRAILFGSVLEDNAEEGSDIDILVSPLPARQYWRFIADLEEALEHPVDVFTQDDDPEFVRKIVERGEIVYEI